MPARLVSLASCFVLLLLSTAPIGAASAPPRAYRDKVEPHWFASNNLFWYRNALPGETSEFVLVDARIGSRKPAFDHARVAVELSRILNREISPSRLPADRLDFDDALTNLTLSGSEGSWRVDLKSYEIQVVPPSDSDALPAESEPRPSARTGPETSILFDNRTPTEVQIVWLDPDGNRQPYGRLKPGESRRQHTFTRHVWAVLRDQSVLAVFEATRESRRAIIDGRPPLPRQPAIDASTRPQPREVASPDGSRIAFVRDHNLWLRQVPAGTSRPLTFDASPGNSFRKDTQRARLVGMDYDTPDAPDSLPDVHWSPDSKHLVAIQTRAVPERRVQLVESAPKNQLQPRLSSYPYFKPGDELPAQTPRLFDLTSDDPRETPVSSEAFANAWELSEFRWAPDSSRFSFLYNRRGHQVMRLLAADAGSGQVHILVDESVPTFFDYSNKTFVEFLDASREVVWMSERSGWNHVYLFDATSGTLRNPITQGDWVVRRVEKLEPEKRRIWLGVSGVHPHQDPYHVHLARVNLDGSDFRILTEGDGTHEIQWSPDRRCFLDTWSRVDQPPITELRSSETGALLCPLESADASEVIRARGRLPERFTAKARDGSTDIWGIIHRPPNYDPAARYPVIENIYAGPHGQHVPKAFRATYGHQEELADAGFIVVQIDGMGTNWRSKRFHDVAWRNIADAGFADRIAWIKAAAERFPSFDLSRVGIYGGSAGGQNALRALLAHGDFYHAAAADCGCHDNRMDKIWWNEAWMGWPIGPHYAEQSNVSQAHRLTGKLLLTVGELDRNVDPSSTYQVVDALIKADKRFEFLPFPGIGHGAAESDYGRRLRRDFFVRHLKPTNPDTPSP